MQNKIISNLDSLIENENPHFLLAVSGGIDSMVLLKFFQKNHESYKFSVAHVNHNYHSDAKKMEHLVQDQCAQMNNDLVIENIFLKGVNSNIESNFRKMRYSKLEEIRKEIKADFILTAHHADDQVETILMKIMNSSGLDGLQGLRKLKQNIIRPMYNISKSEISDYASLNNVKYIDDPTNSDNTFTRNFLRMNVIPELKKIKNEQTPLVDLIDFYSTFEDLLNVEKKTSNGVSLLPLLLGENFDERKYITTYYNPMWGSLYKNRAVYIQNKKYKLYKSGSFYNYQLDPEEKYPLSLKSLDESIMNLHTEMDSILKKVPDLPEINFNNWQEKLKASN